MELNIVRKTETATLPTKAHRGDLGYDVYSDENIMVTPGETRLISTGISIMSSNGKYGLISKIVVLFIISIPVNVISFVSSFTFIIFATLKPILFGRCGVRVENNPTFFPFNCGGFTLPLIVVFGLFPRNI